MINLGEILLSLIQEFSPRLWHERSRLLGLVADRYPDAKRERWLLEVAYRAGIVESLQGDGGEHAQRRAWQRLTGDYVIEADAAWATVAALCGAFGHVVVQANPGESVPAQTKASVVPPAAPKPAATLISGRYRDNGDGTVTDVQTGLQWMRWSLWQKWSRDTCFGEHKTFTFESAAQTAMGLNRSGGYAGYRDWRVPTKEELESLIKQGSRPTIDGVAFPNTPTTVYWSSSPHSDDSRLAWSANLYSGRSYGSYRSYNGAVRLVRSVP